MDETLFFKQNREQLEKFSSFYLRDYAYKNGKHIYDFMDQYNVGKNAYGKLMDSAEKGRKVMAHRLYKHHIIYDMPINDLGDTVQFLEHELSDLFTKQGLPILPGEMIENTNLLKYCVKLENNWNFLNGFDILAGTLAIYSNTKTLKRMFDMELSIDSFDDFAKHMGIAGIDLAIAMSTANPLLLIAASLQFTSGIRGLLNDSSVIRFKKMQDHLTISFSLEFNNIEESFNRLTPKSSLDKLSINRSFKNNKIGGSYGIH